MREWTPINQFMKNTTTMMVTNNTAMVIHDAYDVLTVQTVHTIIKCNNDKERTNNNHTLNGKPHHFTSYFMQMSMSMSMSNVNLYSAFS